LWRGARLALLGIAAGFLVTGALTGLLSRFLFGVGAYDPLTFAGAALFLTLAALAASYVPARKATRIDPMLALRHD
jgi:putative ABC transport system permease protein